MKGKVDVAALAKFARLEVNTKLTADEIEGVKGA